MNQNSNPNGNPYYNQPNQPNQPNQGYSNQPNQPNQGYYNQPQQPNAGYYNQPNAGYYNQPGYRAAANPELAEPVKENVGLGILGALVGSLAGLAVTFLLSMANIMASVAGLLGIFCAYWCYRKFSGASSSKIGIIISAVFTIAACLLGLYLGYVRYVASELNISFSQARELFSYMLERDSDVKGDFIKDCLLLVLFVGLGCIGTISTAAKQIKASKNAGR